MSKSRNRRPPAAKMLRCRSHKCNGLSTYQWNSNGERWWTQAGFSLSAAAVVERNSPLTVGLAEEISLYQLTAAIFTAVEIRIRIAYLANCSW
jgi:hypothetical protein